MKHKVNHGRCSQCQRLLPFGHSVKKLCRSCYQKQWLAQAVEQYRAATFDERVVLDDARAKLVIAFMKGDMDTWAQANQFLREKLKGMRNE